MSFVSITDPRWDIVTFLRCDVVFGFVSDMCIEVTSINMDFVGRVVILLGEGMAIFLDFTFTGAQLCGLDSLSVVSESSTKQLGVRNNLPHPSYDVAHF